MRLLLIAIAVLAFIGVLWGPVTYVAWRLWQRGDASVFPQLRFMLPAQLMAAVALAFTADVLGMRNPPALFAASTVIVSACGTGALALARYIARRRRR
jgi:hypothetical protein